MLEGFAREAPAIVVLAPMFAAIIGFLLGRVNRKLAFPVVLGGLVTALLAAWHCLRTVAVSGKTWEYRMGGWEPPRGIALEVDTLSGVVLLVVAGVALLTALYGMRRVVEETPEKTTVYWTLYSLLCTGLLGMVITADAFNLFVLLEVSSLTSYALIALGSSKRGTLASFQYIIIGTMGASLYLLGVGYLYLKTGSLNMGDISEIIGGRGLANGENLHDSSTIKVAFILITIGIWMKMAFFPLHGWLANAYTYSPSTTSCILAPLMTKVSVYVMLRVMLGVFGIEYIHHLDWGTVIVWLAVVAIIAGSLLALAQTQLKKMLCFLIVAEVGYMVGGAWLANPEGLVGTAYHIVSDALMTVCLFIAASLFWRRFRTHDIDSLSGAFRTMPLTMTAFVLTGLAMIGVPPTCGFFSKWYLVQGGIAAGHYGYVVALLFSSLVNAILFIRIFEKAYFPKDIETAVDHHDHGHDADDHTSQQTPKRPPADYEDAPLWGLVPLYFGVILLFVIGLFNRPITDLLREAIPVITP